MNTEHAQPLVGGGESDEDEDEDEDEDIDESGLEVPGVRRRSRSRSYMTSMRDKRDVSAEGSTTMSGLGDQERPELIG